MDVAGEMIEKFNWSGQVMLSQVTFFIAVLVLIWLFVYLPSVRMRNEEKNKIKEVEKMMKMVEAQLNEISQLREQLLQAAQKEAREVVKKAETESKIQAEERIRVAETEVARIVTSGKIQLAKEKDSMTRESKNELVNIILKATARILEDQVDVRKSTSLAEEVVRKMT